MPLILGANSVTGGYAVDNSLRFNEPSSDKLTRSNGTPTSLRIFTYSTWVKRSTVGNFDIMQSFYSNSSNYTGISFLSTDRLDFINYEGSTTARKITTAKFRDVSAWYHICVAVDTNQATANDRIKMYVNGILETVFDTNTAPSINSDLGVDLTTQAVGVGEGGAIGYLQGYLAETYFIDGQALDPTSFGEFDSDTGIWKPIAYTGTYGTNGYFLEFKDSSALGDDSSGEGNNFTVNNLTSIDQTTDTPTNNFATGNPLNVPTSNLPIFTNGNLTWESSGNSTSNFGGSSTIGVTQGKWYIEAKATLDETLSRNAIGISGEVSTLARNNSTTGSNSSIYYDSETGNKNVNNSGSAYGDTYTTGDIIGIALDLDNGYVYFSKNGVFQNSGVPTSGATGTGGIAVTSVLSTTDGAYFIFQSDTSGSPSTPSKFDFNFGNPPYTVTVPSSDANGYGAFDIGVVPAGYYALCTKNLAEFG